MSIRLLTYNVRYATLDSSPNTWAERRGGVASVVGFHDPEVVCLQEVWQDQLADLRDRLPAYDWVHAGTSSGEHTPIGYRADRFAAVDREVLSLSETPDDLHAMDWETTVPRVTTAAQLREQGTGAEFVVVNTHLDHASEMARRGGAQLLADRFGDRHAPTVLAGDLNCTPDDPPYATLVEDGGFRDARSLAADPHGPLTTFNDFEAPQSGERLDHVFVDGTVTVERFGVLADLDDRALYPSDHFAVLADLAVTD